MQRFLDLFISINYSTCFRRFLRPFPQNCTYSVRYCPTSTAACCYRGEDGTSLNVKLKLNELVAISAKFILVYNRIPDYMDRENSLAVKCALTINSTDFNISGLNIRRICVIFISFCSALRTTFEDTTLQPHFVHNVEAIFFYFLMILTFNMTSSHRRPSRNAVKMSVDFIFQAVAAARNFISPPWQC